MDRPVMQGGRIEVRSAGPHQRLDLTINPNLLEQLQVAQGGVQFARKNRSKVDGLFRGIVKTNTERVSRNDFERANSINRMTHTESTLKTPRLILHRGAFAALAATGRRPFFCREQADAITPSDRPRVTPTSCVKTFVA